MKLFERGAVYDLRLDTQDSFEAVVREHQAAVARTLLRLPGRREDVEDLAQEVFLRLYRAVNLRWRSKRRCCS